MRAQDEQARCTRRLRPARLLVALLLVAGGWAVDVAESIGQVRACLFRASRDTFVGRSARNANEGANVVLSVRRNGAHRALLAFDLAGVDPAQVQRATLVVNVARNLRGWGSRGRLVGAHRLARSFVEGNGASLAARRRKPGGGAGATWQCASDIEISDAFARCAVAWSTPGGDFAPEPTDSALVFNATRGEISFDVTTDVRAGGSTWLLKNADERTPGGVRLHSREGAASRRAPELAPTLVLELDPSSHGGCGGAPAEGLVAASPRSGAATAKT